MRYFYYDTMTIRVTTQGITGTFSPWGKTDPAGHQPSISISLRDFISEDQHSLNVMYIKSKAHFSEEPMAVVKSDFSLPDSGYTEIILINEIIIISWAKEFNKVTASVRAVKAAPPIAGQCKWLEAVYL